MSDKFTIYGDSATECQWFTSLNYRLNSATCINLRYRGQNPEEIERLIRLSRPDIILCKNAKPILVLEKTSETGTGHNHTQRFDRIAVAAEEGVPFIFVHPYDSIKHGEHQGVVKLNLRILKALLILNSIYKTPSISLKIPQDDTGELDFVNKDKIIKKTLELFLENLEQGLDYDFSRELCDMKEFYEKGCEKNPRYLEPPASVTIERTQTLFSNEESFHLNQKSESVVYRIGDKTKQARTDPFTGTAVAYDYLYARDKNGLRKKNLVARFVGSKNEATHSKKWFLHKYPMNQSKLSTYYQIFDALIFHDGIHVCDYSPPINFLDKQSSKKFEFSGQTFIGFTIEEEIYIKFKDKMLREGWILVAGEPPKGTENRPVLEIKPKKTKGSKNSIKPDAVFLKTNKLLIVEFKDKFSKEDETRMINLIESEPLKVSLKEAIEEKDSIKNQFSLPFDKYQIKTGLVNNDHDSEVSDKLVHYCLDKNSEFIQKN
jgi:hypothetical protein